MKAKNILMTLLLVTGAIAAKAAGYPAELALVSQPVMVYNANSITVYYDVENIGDYTYRGSVYLYLSPDYGYYYAEEWVKVRPGHIKRIAINIPASRIRNGNVFTIMPYYELGDELYSFTTFEYFEPITFHWSGPRNERWVVITVGPCLRYYHRPGTYRFYYDGFRPPMHHTHATPPPPMNPMHHTYGYHKEHGGYPTHHFNEGNGPKPNDGHEPKPNGGNAGATVRPGETAGSMSGGSGGTGSMSGGSTKPASSATTGSISGSGTTSRPASNGSISGGSTTSRPASTSTSGSVSRPASNGTTSRPAGTSTSSSGSISRPASNGSTSRPAGTSTSGSISRPSGTSSSSSGSISRPASNGSTSRSSGMSSSSTGRSSGSVSGGSTRSGNSASGRTGSASTGGRTSSTGSAASGRR